MIVRGQTTPCAAERSTDASAAFLSLKRLFDLNSKAGAGGQSGRRSSRRFAGCTIRSIRIGFQSRRRRRRSAGVPLASMSFEIEISARLVPRAVRVTVALLRALLASRSLNERRSITIRWWVPLPISSLPSLADTLKSTRLPSALTTSAVAHTSWPTGVAAKCSTSTAVPTALSPASKNGQTALSAAFSMIRIITGVASTCGSMASLNRLARCSGCTCNIDLPLAPNGICRIHSS